VTDPWPELYELAAACGVATEYWDWQDRHTVVSAETIIGVLAALGVDASTREATEVALYFRWLDRWQRMLPPCLVTRQGWSPWFGVHVDHGADVTVWVETEDGSRRHDVHQQDHWVNPETVDGRLVGEATFAVPADLPTGYHRLVAESGGQRTQCPLIVTPAWVGLPAALADRRTWGLALQLYSVRSHRSWGTGDLTDLTDLTTWAAVRHAAGFVLVNPLHAAEPLAPMEPSPYLPSTRRFVNPLYLRVEAIEEYAYLDASARESVAALRASVASANTADAVDRDSAWAAKDAALRLVHRVPRSPGRDISYETFVADQGDGALQVLALAIRRLALDRRTHDAPQLALGHDRDLDLDAGHLLDQVHRPAGALGQVQDRAQGRLVGGDQGKQPRQVGPLRPAVAHVLVIPQRHDVVPVVADQDRAGRQRLR